MIKVMGAAVLVLAFAAAAQAGGRTSPHFTAWPTTYTQSGGAGIGGGGTGGSGAILHIPPARFATVEVSGSASDYIPSTFVSYNSAVAEGKASLSARPEPLGTSAQENSDSPARKARIQIVQKQNGELAIQR
jgi:hypothetical protein